MSDRKMIKWQPFDSVMNSRSVVNELSYQKEEINMPVLSEEQLYEIQNNLLIGFECNVCVTIKFVKNNHICSVKDKIFKIDVHKKRIILENHSILYFNSIIEVMI